MRMSYLRKPEGMKRGTPKPCDGVKKTLEPAKPVMPSSPLLMTESMPIREDEGSMKRHYARMEKELKRVNPIQWLCLSFSRGRFQRGEMKM